MHQALHAQLESYNYERICRYGAFSTASNLQLKFVVHAGDIERISIKEAQIAREIHNRHNKRLNFYMHAFTYARKAPINE